MKSEEILARQAREIQDGIDEQFQKIVDYQVSLWRLQGPMDNGKLPEPEPLVPAIVELSGMIRVNTCGKIMIPANLPDYRINKLLSRLYHDMDGTECIDRDPDFWKEGTHSLNYEGVV